MIESDGPSVSLAQAGGPSLLDFIDRRVVIEALTVGHTEMVLRMVTAVILGGAIGYERSLRDHPAGLRTHILVSLASATFMLVSTQFVYFQHYANSKAIAGLIHVDPSRIASGVVMGMGFLGAGSILRTGLDVHGLTTAASLWMVSAVGLAAGCGMFPEAITATGAALFVLVGLSFVEGKHKRRVQRRVRVDLVESSLSRSELLTHLETHKATMTKIDFQRDVQNRRARLLLDVNLASETDFEPLLKRLESLPGVRRVRVSDTTQNL